MSIVAGLYPGSPRRGRSGKAKAQQIQFVDESIHYPDKVVLADKVIQAIGKQQPFPPARPFDKASHTTSPNFPIKSLPHLVFSHSLHPIDPPPTGTANGRCGAIVLKNSASEIPEKYCSKYIPKADQLSQDLNPDRFIVALFP